MFRCFVYCLACFSWFVYCFGFPCFPIAFILLSVCFHCPPSCSILFLYVFLLCALCFSLLLFAIVSFFLYCVSLCLCIVFASFGFDCLLSSILFLCAFLFLSLCFPSAFYCFPLGFHICLCVSILLFGLLLFSLCFLLFSLCFYCILFGFYCCLLAFSIAPLCFGLFVSVFDLMCWLTFSVLCMVLLCVFIVLSTVWLVSCLAIVWACSFHDLSMVSVCVSLCCLLFGLFPWFVYCFGLFVYGFVDWFGLFVSLVCYGFAWSFHGFVYGVGSFFMFFSMVLACFSFSCI